MSRKSFEDRVDDLERGLADDIEKRDQLQEALGKLVGRVDQLDLDVQRILRLLKKYGTPT